MDENAAVFLAICADEQLRKFSVQVKPIVFPGMSPI
jgi:hypothetical protein